MIYYLQHIIMFRFLIRYRALVFLLLTLVMIVNAGVFLKSEILYSENTFNGFKIPKENPFSEVLVDDIPLQNINERNIVPSVVFANVQRLYRNEELFKIIVSFGGEYEDMVSIYFYEEGVLVKNEKKIKKYFAGRWSENFSEDDFTLDIRKFVFNPNNLLWTDEERSILEDAAYYKTVEKGF